MSGLARMLASCGVNVSGSEMADSATRVALERELGISIPVGHAPANVGDATLVVASAAIKDGNPELVEAKEREIPIVSRAEMLGRVMDLYEQRIAVSGTHGKTTTSAMLGVVLTEAGLDPTALIGGDVAGWGSNARVGHGSAFVAEACEAYGSFLFLRPTISIITNVEADHLDHYKTFDNVLAAFRQFLSATTLLAVLNADDPHTTSLRDSAAGHVVTFGLGATADVRGLAITGAGNRFRVFSRGEEIGEAALNVPGVHNVRNALSVIAVALELGVPFDAISRGLSKFNGTGRRFERLGETAAGALVIDDYAHHPTEIKATLAAARSIFPDKRIVAVFQPHLPSRTQDLMDDFAASFADADKVVITDIYLSREAAVPGLDGGVLAAKIPGDVTYIADKRQLPDYLATELKSGDVVLTIGAGDIRAAGEGLLALANSGKGE